MRSLLIAGTAAVALAAGGAAFAQAVVEITPQQRTVIKQYVVKQDVAAVQIPGEVRVGAVLPADVELHSVPSDWGPALTEYRYVYWNDRVVLVEPGSRKVIHIVN